MDQEAVIEDASKEDLPRTIGSEPNKFLLVKLGNDKVTANNIPYAFTKVEAISKNTEENKEIALLSQTSLGGQFTVRPYSPKDSPTNAHPIKLSIGDKPLGGAIVKSFGSSGIINKIGSAQKPVTGTNNMTTLKSEISKSNESSVSIPIPLKTKKLVLMNQPVSNQVSSARKDTAIYPSSSLIKDVPINLIHCSKPVALPKTLSDQKVSSSGGDALSPVVIQQMNSPNNASSLSSCTDRVQKWTPVGNKNMEVVRSTTLQITNGSAKSLLSPNTNGDCKVDTDFQVIKVKKPDISESSTTVSKPVQFEEHSDKCSIKVIKESELENHQDTASSKKDVLQQNGVTLVESSNEEIKEANKLDLVYPDVLAMSSESSQLERNNDTDDLELNCTETISPKKSHHSRKSLHKEQTDVKKEGTDNDILRCSNCWCYGVREDFIVKNSIDFCNESCAQEYATKKPPDTTKSKETSDKLRKGRKPKNPKIPINQDGSYEKSDYTTQSENETTNNKKASKQFSAPNVNQELTKVAFAKHVLPKQSYSAKEFTWKSYLESCFNQAKAAPKDLWVNPIPDIKCQLKCGMKLEGIDPQHQSLFCVLSVTDVIGHRVRLHFDGYSEQFDFWSEITSPNLFPVNWCKDHNRKVQPPPGHNNFNWKNYLKTTQSQAVPKSCFMRRRLTTSNLFEIGMKLEAEDRKNNWICVATVADILDSRILVNFDGWESSFDVWFDVDSPYIHPMGWCQENKIHLYAPNNYHHQDSFNWHEYLIETQSIAAPNKAFKRRRPKAFKNEMKVEVLDKRNPKLLRVASIVEVEKYRVKVHFDGWDDMYDYWLEDDSPEIHPPNWGMLTGHPLQPPLTPQQCAEDVDSGLTCGTPGCKSVGHIKNNLYATHHTSFGCPYSYKNYNIDLESLLPDRLEQTFNRKSTKRKQDSPDALHGEEMSCKRVRKRRRFFDEITHTEAVTKQRLPVPQVKEEVNEPVSRPTTPKEKPEPDWSAPKTSYELIMHRSIFNPESQPSHLIPNLPDRDSSISYLLNNCDVGSSNVCNFSPDEVARFVRGIQGCEPYANKFIQEDIDGRVLSLFTIQMLVNLIGMTIGSALKLHSIIWKLK